MNNHGLLYPVLYVFLPTSDDVRQIIEARSAVVFPNGGVFFLTVNALRDNAQNIRAIKATIQENEAQLTLSQVHVYIISQAHRSDEIQQQIVIFNDLRTYLADDFIMPVFTLCALLYEGMNTSDNMQHYLQSLPDFAMGFDYVFLLSDRNELHVIHPKHKAQMLEVVARLPLLQRNNTPLFSQLKTKQFTDNALILLTAGIIFDECPVATPQNEVEEVIKPIPDIPIEDITNYLQSVTTNPCHILRLRNLPLKNAEAILFNQRLASVFTEKYGDVPLPMYNGNESVKAWRVSSVIRTIARQYAFAYQAHRQKTATRIQAQVARIAEEKIDKQQAITLLHEVLINQLHQAKPPPVMIPLLRFDGLFDETFRFLTETPCILRIVGGFSPQGICVSITNVSTN